MDGGQPSWPLCQTYGWALSPKTPAPLCVSRMDDGRNNLARDDHSRSTKGSTRERPLWQHARAQRWTSTAGQPPRASGRSEAGDLGASECPGCSDDPRVRFETSGRIEAEEKSGEELRTTT